MSENIPEYKAEISSKLELLRKPFHKSQISQLPKPTCSRDEYSKLPKAKCSVCSGWHATSKTIHLSYVGHAALTNRLLEVDPTWAWEPLALDDKGLPLFDKNGGLWINLTICGVTRLGYGNAKLNQYAEIGSREKEVIGDALRNAAMRFGAALDLWTKSETPFVNSEDASVEPKKESRPQNTKNASPLKPRPDLVPELKEATDIDSLAKIWKAIQADLKKLPKAEQDKLLALKNSLKLKLSRPADTVNCPAGNGNVPVQFCSDECKKREGCPAHE